MTVLGDPDVQNEAVEKEEKQQEVQEKPENLLVECYPSEGTEQEGESETADSEAEEDRQSGYPQALDHQVCDVKNIFARLQSSVTAVHMIEVCSLMIYITQIPCHVIALSKYKLLQVAYIGLSLPRAINKLKGDPPIQLSLMFSRTGEEASQWPGMTLTHGLTIQNC